MFGISSAHTELRALLTDAERAALARPGCRRYTFSTSLADPDRFVLVSEWDDQAALDAHYASPEFTRFQSALHGRLAKPSEMTVYTVADAARLLPSGPMDPRDAD